VTDWKNLLAGLFGLTTKAPSTLGEAFRRGQDLDGGSPGERLTDPYRRSAWVRGAIEKVSGPIAAVSVEWYPVTSGPPRARRFLRRRPAAARRSPDAEEIALPVMDAFFAEPMPGLGYSDFVEGTVGWLKLAGESFWLLPDDAMLPFPQERAVAPQTILARPDRMQHIVEANQIKGWRFTDAAGRQWTLLPEQVIHLKSWNPYDLHRGLGAYEAAALAADTDYLAGKFARNLMANNGDTGPYINSKTPPTDEQREQILTDLRAKRAAQLRGQFRPVFLYGDISVEDPQIQTIDAAQIMARVENRHEIFVALGVPPSMADVKAAYSIGSASDFFQLILNTCIPTGEKFADGLARLAKVFTGATVEAYLDWDEHPVMQEVRKERLASVDVLWSKGMPLRDVSEYLNLNLPEFVGDSVGYLPFGVAPTESLDASPAPSPETNPDLAEPDPVETAINALRQPRPEAPDCDCCSCSFDTLDTRGRDPKEIAQWKSIIAPRLATIRAYRSKFSRVLMAARREVLAKLDAANPPSALRTPHSKGVASDFLFSLADFSADFSQAMRVVGLDAVASAGKQLFGEVGKPDPWKNPPQATLEFLVDRENKMSDVPQQVFERIKDQLAEGFENGESISKISARIRSEFNAIDSERGRVIAQTETGAAYGFGRHEAIKAAGFTHKKWLTSGNDNVRKAHRVMNLRVVIPIGEPFIVTNPKTGEQDAIMHPGDSDGAPWNVINCHCTELPATANEVQ
jgi:hypothetical protein